VISRIYTGVVLKTWQLIDIGIKLSAVCKRNRTFNLHKIQLIKRLLYHIKSYEISWEGTFCNKNIASRYLVCSVRVWSACMRKSNFLSQQQTVLYTQLDIANFCYYKIQRWPPSGKCAFRGRAEFYCCAYEREKIKSLYFLGNYGQWRGW